MMVSQFLFASTSFVTNAKVVDGRVDNIDTHTNSPIVYSCCIQLMMCIRFTPQMNLINEDNNKLLWVEKRNVEVQELGPIALRPY